MGDKSPKDRQKKQKQGEVTKINDFKKRQQEEAARKQREGVTNESNKNNDQKKAS